MAEVTVFIAGRSYVLDCDEGQEEHLRKLGKHLDSRVRELQASSRIQNDLELLVITGILLSDDLSDVNYENIELRKEVARLEAQLRRDNSGALPVSHATPDISQISARLDAMAGRMERLAETAQES
ncbi:MAG: cell division protein ZapA [Alphaproteobacteria bacterium]|nr:cell division protein ZapA [Alphaproteobacteria bacterium]